MNLKNMLYPKKSTKSLNKTYSSDSHRKKKSPIPRTVSKKREEVNSTFIQPNNHAQWKKKEHKTLQRKKIQDLKTPQLMIKINYKGKRLSIPIHQVNQKSLKDTVLPHIVRFEKQIFRNADFKSCQIQNWKTSGRVDVLKDYYYQINKPITIFKGQSLQIQPIWRNPKPNPLGLQDLEIIKCIGTGGFSRVFLVRMKNNGKFFALKLMEKQQLLDTGKECVVINERQIMIRLDNPHVLALQFAFETKHFFALGLQYCPGGELFYYLRKVKRMTQNQARYCFVQILLGIQYLHQNKIIYRDIKPENIMIDLDGNLKIADFGLSKIWMSKNQRSYTFCGSPQYMAPEMLNKSGHTYSVDYYCMGALLYQLVTGNPPFYSRDVDKIYYSIQNQQIQFPDYVDLTPQIKMLLQGLLIKDPSRRLGSLGGIRQILGHPWVRKIKPTDITERKIQTPIKIDLMTFNINDEEVQQNQTDFTDKFYDEDDDFQHVFQDFYFRRNQPINIDQALPSVKSDSTKQNKSLNIKARTQIKKTRQSNDYVNNIKKETHQHIKSQLGVPKLVKCKKGKSKKTLNLVERGRKREYRQISNSHINGNKRIGSPKEKKKNTLKRIKSSNALFDQRVQSRRVTKL